MGVFTKSFELQRLADRRRMSRHQPYPQALQQRCLRQINASRGWTYQLQPGSKQDGSRAKRTRIDMDGQRQ
jgi:hypothetical protein